LADRALTLLSVRYISGALGPRLDRAPVAHTSPSALRCVTKLRQAPMYRAILGQSREGPEFLYSIVRTVKAAGGPDPERAFKFKNGAQCPPAMPVSFAQHTAAPVNSRALAGLFPPVSPCFMSLFSPKTLCNGLNNHQCCGTFQ
jgi:hypothetical protein